MAYADSFDASTDWMIDHYAVYLVMIRLIKTVNGQKTVHIVDINTVSILTTSDNENNIVAKDFQHTFVYLQTSFP